MTKMLDRDGGAIGWCECGAGEPVVFIHAMVTSRIGWAAQFETLGSGYRCIAVDLPGFGTSKPLGPQASWKEALPWLDGFLDDAIGSGPAHFVGLSVGGMMLQHFAASRPDRVKSIAMLDCSPKFGFGNNSSGAEFERWVMDQLASRSLPEFSADMVRAIVAPETGQDVIDTALAAMGRASREGLELTARLIAGHDGLEALPKIKCSTLVMAGEHDKETPPAYAREIANRILNANLTIVPGAGHILNIEAPDAVSDRLRVFLKHGA